MPASTSIVASPIGRMLSVRNILSGSCRSIVISPVTCRSPISRWNVPDAVSPSTLLKFFAPPSASRACASSCSDLLSPATRAAKPPSVTASDIRKAINRCIKHLVGITRVGKYDDAPRGKLLSLGNRFVRDVKCRNSPASLTYSVVVRLQFHDRPALGGWWHALL